MFGLITNKNYIPIEVSYEYEIYLCYVSIISIKINLSSFFSIFKSGQVIKNCGLTDLFLLLLN